MTKQHMPGEMDESPAKGEPTKNKPKDLKNVFDLVLKPPPESHSEDALGLKYGARKNTGRTQSGNLGKEGLDRPDKGGDRPTEGLGGPSISEAYWGQGYPETNGNILGTFQGLGQFYCTVTN